MPVADLGMSVEHLPGHHLYYVLQYNRVHTLKFNNLAR